MEINYVELLNDMKKLVKDKVVLPQIGEIKNWDVKSILLDRQSYIISVNRSSKNHQKCTFHAMTSDTKVGILRLGVGDTLSHRNPDGSKVKGTHLHIYKDGLELSEAIEFNIDNENLLEYSLSFLIKFNIIDVTLDSIICIEQAQLFS